MVELGDGRVWMLMRTELGTQYESFSADGGETFSRPKPSRICSPRSPISITRLGNGDLLLVWNDISDMSTADRADDTKTWLKRNRLRTAVSSDDGRSWRSAKWLEDDPDGWFCYTAVCELDGHLLFAYNNKGRLNGLVVADIPLGWLYKEEKE